ncbi:MAG TPA: hypothetical protein VM509_11625 [Planctomycetota bacterium]|nr:hypothetical protein [Planctomycetota bacterium]
MRQEDVPQDRAKAFQGRKKALYAQGEDGKYRVVPSSGWEAEEIVLDQAIEEYERAAADAFARAKAGTTSPLEYHMCQRRMDVVLLAQSTGFFRWQVKRHLRPGAFAKLSNSKRARYAEALGLEASALDQLPASP